MIERLLLATALIAVGVIAYQVFISTQRRRTTTLVPCDPLLNNIQRGTPVIVYFTTPTCVPCRTIQSPALMKLQTELGGELQVIKVDATECPEDADRWGVFSAPTTFVIDAQGVTRAVNHGVADYAKLKRQLNMV
jgi:thioredoxin-like negative regulator of GroEL